MMYSEWENKYGVEIEKPLNILHLEDDPLDRELVRRALDVAGVPCELVYAETKLKFEDALDCGTFDLVLSDFTLPGYNGLSALAFVREKYPELPFLFISGTIGEEQAVECLKKGATDYVLKKNLERLKPAIQSALWQFDEHAKRRSAEQALKAAKEAAEATARELERTTEALKGSEAFLHSLGENSPVHGYRTDTEGRLIFANNHYC